MLDVHQHQLLVLLLVMDAELDQRRDRRPRVAVGAGDERKHRVGHSGAVSSDLADPRPRQQPALRPRMARADLLVVGVEQVAERGVERAVAGNMFLEQERLEEPGGVREVPLGRAHIGHRLDGLVLGQQPGGQRLAGGADLAKPVGPLGARGRRHGRTGCGADVEGKRGHGRSCGWRQRGAGIEWGLNP
jgi:hypothetical protein